MKIIDILVPDIGNFSEISVIDVLIKVGEMLKIDTPMITLETDKATIDVPAPLAGIVKELLVVVGDKISTGSLIARVQIQIDAVPLIKNTTGALGALAPAVNTPIFNHQVDLHAPVLVIGAGPGGYTAAFRAADLGFEVVLLERWENLGGVCLNVGCIPSKALLHAAKVLDEVESMSAHGLEFGQPRIDIDKLRSWKSGIVSKLTGGLQVLAKKRKIKVLKGDARFVAPGLVELSGQASFDAVDSLQRISFDNCIIATGSEPVRLSFIPDDPRVMDSTAALELQALPKRLLVIGGGIIGLEMGCVYDALGVKVTVVESMSQLMPGCDADLVKPLEMRLRKRYEQILLKTKVKEVISENEGLRVIFEGEGAPKPQLYDRVLVAVGRKPNGDLIGAELAGVAVDARGFIVVDKKMRTNVSNIFAIGDVVGQPMLAHKATHEGKVAAEVIAGKNRAFDARVIPSVAYTDPEIAWVGLTEDHAKENNVAYEKGVFPWAASGRSLAQGRNEGLTKLLFDPHTHRILGGGLVGPNAGELIAEITLAIEMGADAADVGLTIHPHPTLSETIGFAAEAFEGTLTDLYLPKSRT